MSLFVLFVSFVVNSKPNTKKPLAPLPPPRLCVEMEPRTPNPSSGLFGERQRVFVEPDQVVGGVRRAPLGPKRDHLLRRPRPSILLHP